MIRIQYTKKPTSASTTYMTIEKKDMDVLITKMMALQSFFNELSISSNTEIREAVKWYTKPNKTLPFNRQFSKNNSPCSFIAGMINNLVYSDQQDCSEIQAQHIQNILNTTSELISVINDMGIKLQKNANYEAILFCETLFEYQ